MHDLDWSYLPVGAVLKVGRQKPIQAEALPVQVQVAQHELTRERVEALPEQVRVALQVEAVQQEPVEVVVQLSLVAAEVASCVHFQVVYDQPTYLPR